VALQIKSAAMQTGKLNVEGRAGTNAGQHILSVRGTITLETVVMFQEAVRACNDPSLIIDLTEVPYVDSAALGAFVQAYVSCAKSGRRLALVGPTPRVRTVFHLTSLDILFPTYATLPEAEAALA
jgi:anti-sigma B factor antagonist